MTLVPFIPINRNLLVRIKKKEEPLQNKGVYLSNRNQSEDSCLKAKIIAMDKDIKNLQQSEYVILNKNNLGSKFSETEEFEDYVTAFEDILGVCDK